VTTHYDTLDVPPDADQAAITAAYRKLSLRWHPDRPDGDVERMAAINAAYEILSDPDLREAYDAGGDDYSREVQGYVVNIFGAAVQSHLMGARIQDFIAGAHAEIDKAVEALHTKLGKTLSDRDRLQTLVGRVETTSVHDAFGVAVQQQLDALTERQADLERQIRLLGDVRVQVGKYRDKMADLTALVWPKPTGSQW